MQTENSETFAFLRSIREFQLLPSSELKALADTSRFISFDPGDYITIEGDEERSCGFIVASGIVAMLKTSANGKELIVELLQSGDIFGLLLTVAGDRLPAQLSARSLQKCNVLCVPVSNCILLLKEHPVLFKEFVAHLLQSLHSSYRLSRGLAHDRVEIRIASVLSSLALKFSEPTPGERPYTIKFTRQQLADLTGTTPETAIRVTRAMQREGLIDIKRPGIIRIVDLIGLHKLAEEY